MKGGHLLPATTRRATFERKLAPLPAANLTARQLAQRANDCGLHFYREKRYAEAEAQFTEALKLRPTSLGNELRRSLLYETAGCLVHPTPDRGNCAVHFLLLTHLIQKIVNVRVGTLLLVLVFLSVACNQTGSNLQADYDLVLDL